MFQINDKVFYPGYGVATIEDIIEKNVAGRKTRFFKLKFLYKDMVILVPFKKDSKNVGIRHLSNKKTVVEAINELYKVPKKKEKIANNKKGAVTDFLPNSWNRRNKDYQLKIQSGNLLDMIRIYRDLMYSSRSKELSFGEKKLLRMTRELLSEEILVIENSNRDVVMQLLQEPFQQFNFSENFDSESNSILSVV